jgi:outer membrane protein TolC
MKNKISYIMKVTWHRKYNLFLFISMLLFKPLSVSSQTDSLMQYLEIAAKNNPIVLQKYNEYQAAMQKVPQVGSLPDPELSIGVFLSPMEVLAGKQVADFRLMQMFPWFGVLKNGKDEMSLMAKANYESFRDAKLQVFFDVQRTWYELQKLQQNIRISEKNIEILHTLERLSVIKFQASSSTGNSQSSSSGNASSGSSQNVSSSSSGMNSMGGNAGATKSQPSSSMQSSSMAASSGGSGLVDVYRIEIEIGDLENNVALLKNQQKTIVARFNSYLNRSMKTPVSLPDSLKSDTLAYSLALVFDSMLTNNPMLGMLQFEQQSIDAKKKMVTRMGYPMIGVGLNYSLINKSEMSTSAMNGEDMIMPMLTVTLPIYRKKYKAMQTEADFKKTATELGYKATANSLQTEYYEAMQQYEDAQLRIKLNERQSELAQKSLDIMTKSFSASGANLSDLLRIRQQLLDYEFKKIEAIADYNTSIAWLKRLMAVSEIKE